MSAMSIQRLRLVLLIGLAAIVLGVASTFALAAVGPGTRNAGSGASIKAYPYVARPCEVPALPGTVVNVTSRRHARQHDGARHDGARDDGPGMIGPGPGGQFGPARRIRDTRGRACG